MGFTLHLNLGVIVILLMLCSIGKNSEIEDRAHNNTQDDSEKEIYNNSNIYKNLKTESTERIVLEDSLLRKNNSSNKDDEYKSENTKLKQSNRENIARSIDIEKYISKDFHNKNNVYSLPTLPDTEEYTNKDLDYHQSRRNNENYTTEYNDGDHIFNKDLTTPKSTIFDNHFKETVESVGQALEHFDNNSHKQLGDTENTSVDLYDLFEKTKKDNDSNVDYKIFKNIVKNVTQDQKTKHQDLILEEGRKFNFESKYNQTKIIDITPTVTKNVISVTKPATYENYSQTSILNNNIESDNVKSVDNSSNNFTLNYTTPGTLLQDVPVTVISKTKVTTLQQKTKLKKNVIPEQQVQENQIIPMQISAPNSSYNHKPVDIHMEKLESIDSIVKQKKVSHSPDLNFSLPAIFVPLNTTLKSFNVDNIDISTTTPSSQFNNNIINKSTENKNNLPTSVMNKKNFSSATKSLSNFNNSISTTTGSVDLFKPIISNLSTITSPKVITTSPTLLSENITTDDTPFTVISSFESNKMNEDLTTTTQIEIIEENTTTLNNIFKNLETTTEDSKTLTTINIASSTILNELTTTETPVTTSEIVTEYETISAIITSTVLDTDILTEINTATSKESIPTYTTLSTNPVELDALFPTTEVPTTTVESVIRETTPVQQTTEEKTRTSKGVIFRKTTTKVESFTSSTKTDGLINDITKDHNLITTQQIQTDHVHDEYEITTELSIHLKHIANVSVTTDGQLLDFEANNTTPTDCEEIADPPDENKATIAAIVISTIGAICLILLAGLLFVMRKRQKRFSYGQRCTPVSLDDYSMDNISVYNSVRRKGANRSSKRSYGNPAFEDPASICHPLNFPALGKFSNNLEDIEAEFEEIPQITAKTNELPEGCDTKNRYANVIPLPETRVFLKPIESHPNSDYINANFVTGPKNIKGYYIACQAPMQNTVDDFWRMIWEQQTKVILMLTHLFENGVEKCYDYLPPSEVLDCHRLFGDFQVTLKKREVKDKYIISILQLKNMVSNSWREVVHFWYLGWPEKGVPTEANSMIAFLIEARSYMKSSSIDRKQVNNGNLSNGRVTNEVYPVVVHCSPGTGRTGVVITCDIAIQEFEQTRLVDVPKIVYKIRRDRAGSVQTKEQYAFIYKVIDLYATKLTGGALDSL